MGFRLVENFHTGAIPMVRAPLADDATGWKVGDLGQWSSNKAARVTASLSTIQNAGIGQTVIGIFHGTEQQGVVPVGGYPTSGTFKVGSSQPYASNTIGLFIPIIPGALYEADGAGTAAAVGDSFDVQGYDASKGTVIQKQTTAASMCGVVHEVVATNLYRVKFANNVG